MHTLIREDRERMDDRLCLELCMRCEYVCAERVQCAKMNDVSHLNVCVSELACTTVMPCGSIVCAFAFISNQF